MAVGQMFSVLTISLLWVIKTDLYLIVDSEHYINIGISRDMQMLFSTNKFYRFCKLNSTAYWKTSGKKNFHSNIFFDDFSQLKKKEEGN